MNKQFPDKAIADFLKLKNAPFKERLGVSDLDNDNTTTIEAMEARKKILLKRKERKKFRKKTEVKKPLKAKKRKRPERIKDSSVPEITDQQRRSYKDFLKSAYWKYVRNLIFKRDGRLCSRCPSTKTLQIHHLTYKNHCFEHVNLQDLVILCRKCHEKEHDIKK